MKQKTRKPRPLRQYDFIIAKISDMNDTDFFAVKLFDGDYGYGNIPRLIKWLIQAEKYLKEQRGS